RRVALALVNRRDVLGTATVTLEVVAFVEGRLARQRPEHLTVVGCDADHKIGKLRARAEHERQRSPRAILALVMDHFHDRTERLPYHVALRAEPANGRPRQVADMPLGIGCPKPADVLFFEGVEHGEALLVVEHGEARLGVGPDGRLARARGGIPDAEVPQHFAHSHSNRNLVSTRGHGGHGTSVRPGYRFTLTKLIKGGCLPSVSQPSATTGGRSVPEPCLAAR